MRFRSKIDGWLVALALGPMVAIAGAQLAGVPIGRGRGGAPVVLLFVMAALVATMATTRYVVSDEAITVWFGPIRRRRRLEELARMRASRSVESSPAWSLDRIELATTRGFWLLVSPADRAGFVRAVRARAPHVQLDAELTRLL